MSVTIEQLADEMYEAVKEANGVKKLKPGEVMKAAQQKHGDGEVSKKDCKAALKLLIDSGRCVYEYFGGTFIGIPRVEAAANE
ncbi:MAG: hypothetical protein Q7S53_02430 [bacterium]|nr:hypothetical protein [bacterium]